MPLNHQTWTIQTSAFRLQSSLYSIKNKANKRRIYNFEKMVSTGPYTITFTGEELLQYDLAVLYSILHKAQHSDYATNTVEISISQILQALQSSDGSSQRRALHKSIERSAQTELLIQTADKSYQFNQITSFEFNNITKTYTITLPDAHFELENDHPCQVNIFARNQLAQGLTSWIYGLVVSATEPHIQLSLDQLRELCGAEIKNHYAFKGCVLRSVDVLQQMRLIEPDWIINQQNALQLTRKETKTNTLLEIA